MMKRIFTAALAAVAGAFLVGCQAASEPEFGGYRFRIRPLLTRVTGTNFDRDDRIGVTIVTAEGAYAENRELTYDGSCFSAAGFIWYNDLTKTSTLYAYYPFDAAGTPTRFTVSSDQRAEGFAQSDLLAAVSSSVTPSASPVEMLFDHLMSKVRLNLTNQSDGAVTGLTVGGSVLQAEVNIETKQASANGTATAEITPREVAAGTRYEAIVVPQEAALRVTVLTNDGKSHVHTLEQTLLLPGRVYTVNLTLSNIDLTATFSGEVTDWTSGGTIGEAPASPSDDPVAESGVDPNSGAEANGTTLLYGGESYRTVTLADGRVWMAENLRYNPGEESALASGAQGVRYPGAELTDAESIRSYGLLYTAEAALGTANIEQTIANPPCRGICPEGWHIPSADEFQTLIAASKPFPADFVEATPYYWNGVTNTYKDQTSACLWSATAAAEIYDETLKALCVETTATPLDPCLISRRISFGLPLRCIQDR